jgi:predicted dehydrogenase
MPAQSENHTMPPTRRAVMQTAATAAAAATASGFSAEAIHELKLAVIGCGDAGRKVLKQAIAVVARGVKAKLVALCDVDSRQTDKALEILPPKSDPPRIYDYSKDHGYTDLLKAERPDIVVVATPDHWHALIATDALRAEANVFLELPVCHTILEGGAIQRAATKYKRLVQVNSQRRLSQPTASAKAFIKARKAGKIGFVRIFEHGQGGQAEPAKSNTPEPGRLAWDAWCGPARKRPYNDLITADFSKFLDYGNGVIAAEGVPWFDQVLWILDEKWPRRVFSTGGRPILGRPVEIEAANGSAAKSVKPAQTTDCPDHQSAAFEFESTTVVWEHRSFGGHGAETGDPAGCYFYGSEGILHLPKNGAWTFYPSDSRAAVVASPPPAEGEEADSEDKRIRDLWADLLESIQFEQRPKADLEAARRSTNMALLAMISLKTGRSLQWDGEKEAIIGDDFANGLLRRDYRPGYNYPVLA